MVISVVKVNQIMASKAILLCTSVTLNKELGNKVNNLSSVAVRSK